MAPNHSSVSDHMIEFHVKVGLDGVPISDHGRGYGFRSYISKKLSMPFITKSSSLLSHYWVEDGDKDEIKVNASNLSEAFKSRKEIIKKLSRCTFCLSPYGGYF